MRERLLAERCQTAAEVADLLGRHLAHLQQPALAPKPARLVRRCTVNHRARRVALAVSLLSAIGLGLAGFWRPAGTDPPSDAGGQSNELQSAPRRMEEIMAPVGLTDWKGFERELEQARLETAEVERQVQQADVSRGPPDPVPAIDWEMQLLETQLNAAAP